MNKKIICNRCVTKFTTAKINFFNDKSICNYCIDFEKKIEFQKKIKKQLKNLLSKLKSSNQKYNCIYRFVWWC